ncbi:MAG: hypothetical protein LQ345_001670 [Seirophora villosa]|nr:MAG: hypothetical protein LQ345_001670 [Seirophora villosa]
MHAFKPLGLLTLPPLFHASLSTCRLVPALQYPQCSAPWTDFRSLGRSQFHIASTRASHSSANPSNTTYKIGAAFVGKGQTFDFKQNVFAFEPTRKSSNKHPFTGRPASGQDAFFISSVGNGASTAFGIADGVGGWAESGIDPSDFSHGLCRYMANRAIAFHEDHLGARQLLERGYQDVVEDKEITGGGSTACVAVGDSLGYLEVANLGDSGFVQLRLNAVHYYSNPQTHAFNTPYQLSIIPPRILARSRIFGGMPLRDFPRDASVTSHEVRHGDVLIFATDGVWDNLSSSQLLKIVSEDMSTLNAWQTGGKGTIVGNDLEALTKEGVIPSKEDISLQTRLAKVIARKAKAASQDRRRDGPFAKEVQKFYPHENFHGGKVDDICVVVAVVVGANDAAG